MQYVMRLERMAQLYPAFGLCHAKLLLDSLSCFLTPTAPKQVPGIGGSLHMTKCQSARIAKIIPCNVFAYD